MRSFHMRSFAFISLALTLGIVQTAPAEDAPTAEGSV